MIFTSACSAQNAVEIGCHLRERRDNASKETTLQKRGAVATFLFSCLVKKSLNSARDHCENIRNTFRA